MSRPNHSLYYKIIALVLAFLVLGLGIAGSSPRLHDALHGDEHCHGNCHSDTSSEDGNGENHFCAVTLLQIGATWSIDFSQLELSGVVFEWPSLPIEEPEQTQRSLPGNRSPPIDGII